MMGAASSTKIEIKSFPLLQRKWREQTSALAYPSARTSLSNTLSHEVFQQPRPWYHICRHTARVGARCRGRNIPTRLRNRKGMPAIHQNNANTAEGRVGGLAEPLVAYRATRYKKDGSVVYRMNKPMTRGVSMKKIVVLLMVLLLVGGIAFSQASQEKAKDQPVKIGFLVKMAENSWFQDEWKFAQMAADSGFELIKSAPRMERRSSPPSTTWPLRRHRASSSVRPTSNPDCRSR